MSRPFILIDYTMSKRDEFIINEGSQPTCAIFILTKGCFEIETFIGKEIVRKGDIVILPDFIHFKRKVLSEIEFWYIKFKVNDKYPVKFELPYGKINFKDKERISSDIRLYNTLTASIEKNSYIFREHIMEDILFQAMIENSDVLKTKKDTIYDDTVLCAINFIRDNLEEKISLENICRAANTNASTLNFKFNREIGISPINYMLSEKIKLAKHFLLNTSYSICQISEKCGFQNTYYFSSFFKKYCGVSPSVYRKNNF